MWFYFLSPDTVGVECWADALQGGNSRLQLILQQTVLIVIPHTNLTHQPIYQSICTPIPIC